MVHFAERSGFLELFVICEKHNIITVIKVIHYVSAFRSTDNMSLLSSSSMLSVRGFETNEDKIRLVYLEATYSLEKPEDHVIITSD